MRWGLRGDLTRTVQWLISLGDVCVCVSTSAWCGGGGDGGGGRGVGLHRDNGSLTDIRDGRSSKGSSC